MADELPKEAGIKTLNIFVPVLNYFEIGLAVSKCRKSTSTNERARVERSAL
jgi:hypothetical protein